MKKMIGFITVLVILLSVAFVTETKKQATKEKEIPIVGILQLTSHPALDKIYEGIMDALKEEGFVDKKNIKIDFQNAQGDQSNLKTMSERFANEQAAVMVGIATPSAQALANASKEIPIVLGAVTDPKGAGLVADNQHPGGNITGVSDLTPIKAQFNLIKTLLPDAKKIGIIYSSSEDNSVVQGKQAEEEAKKSGLEPITATVSSTNDVNQVATNLAGKVDAIYVPADNTVASAMNTLISVTDAKGIPVFPAVDTMVAEGGLATVGLNQYELGKMTGKMTADLLKGKKKAATTPIEYLKHGDTIINPKKAEKLGITIPQEMLDHAIIN
ncbi:MULTISPECIES: tryptophan ABC transporter substrate-binding protein [Carnobacterium]|uniref:ABC transporter substrate-binding protein n=1 Tax=Carnobacterium divergens TaxID=2748 RepID=A0A5F0MBX2_CARDV|nr:MULTISPECIES: tryptophan ABC transporter substrate-binding protein [Carnobacterium]MDT1938848.1 ABC transporter substrate-binding protein [Carnobacterium divergens]MDT1941286.1 ABC transporter substrate-binding protein [Carnobacterium divergens]MDT1947084.1 ABC transporter substrate-binding protein [Carnobacterium divergens]MDT1949522.1 ABC transporter substrate-binding protein [Carnobacterium divergens]MDT1954700.1 ABC transporter substrate-binding protein [Carnobacterium divergens]